MAVLVSGCRPPAMSEVPRTMPVVTTTTPSPPVASVAMDRDADGVADAADACPDEPEDVDGFEDGDGCVDRDNDGDGVLDAFEWKNGRWTNCDYKVENDHLRDCRDWPEDIDEVQDADGCPDVLVFDCLIRLGTVEHDGRGMFVGDAAKEFDVMAEALREAAGVHLWVAGHVEHKRDMEAARRASVNVAERAAEELVRRGVARERIEVIGMGSLRPRADDRRAEGRAANRRVEFDLKNCGLPLDPPTNECI